MAVLMIPFLTFGAVAAYVAGVGAASWWASRGGPAPPLGLEYVASGALQLGWMTCAARGRAPVLTGVGFVTSVSLCRDGFRTFQRGEAPWTAAVLIESLVLLVALALRSPVGLAERLRRWRRARDEMALQIRMGDGLLPWARDCVARLIAGRADVPLCQTFRRLAAELAEVQNRLAFKVSGWVGPEPLRQFLQVGAAQLLTQAEHASATLAVELEKRTLALAAACREQCDSLPGLAPDERSRAARQCEELLFDLMQPAGQTVLRRRP